MKMTKKWQRLLELQEELKQYKANEETEKQIAAKIFANINRSNQLNIPNIRYMLTAKSTFNGDVLLIAKNPNGNLHAILGDFTGHGLSAAIGTIPLAQAFYTMTEKGFSVKEILKEVNSKLKQLLPANIFCAATMLEINFSNMTLSVCNCGLPKGFLYRIGQGIYHEIVASHPPLGIIDDSDFSAEMTIISVEQGDKLYLYSDGVIEATNEAGKFFGEERVKSIIQKQLGDSFEEIKKELAIFSAKGDIFDDVTLLELTI